MASLFAHVVPNSGTKKSQSQQRYIPVQETELEKESDCVPRAQCCNRGALLRLSLFANFVGLVFMMAIGVMMLSRTSRTAPCSPTGNSIMTNQLLADQYGLPGKIPVKYELLRHGLDEDDFVAGNRYWADLFPKGGGLVLLSDESVKNMRLPPSMRIPSVGNRSLYEMAGYHSLHCLTSVRASIAGFVKAQKTGKPYLLNDDGWNHLKHCLADARENTLCHLDETLFAVENGLHPGDGQTRLCKQLGPINEWLEDNYEDFHV